MLLPTAYRAQAKYVKETWKDLKEYGIRLKLKNFSHIRQWLLD
jgi:hypothetical protein